MTNKSEPGHFKCLHQSFHHISKILWNKMFTLAWAWGPGPGQIQLKINYQSLIWTRPLGSVAKYRVFFNECNTECSWKNIKFEVSEADFDFKLMVNLGHFDIWTVENVYFTIMHNIYMQKQ